MEKISMRSDKFMEAWPQKHYTCSFCRRIFKSAQALGGHMNVHRRDRAMLRQPPSSVLQYPNPNPSRSPNPKYSSLSSSSSSSPSATFSPYKLNSLMSPSLISSFSSLSSASTDEEKMPTFVTGSRCNPLIPRHGDIAKRSIRATPRVGKLKGFAQEDHEFKVLNNGEIVSLDLEMELLRDGNEELDLELRLGYS